MRFMKSVNWKIVGIILVLSIATALYAADTKISALAADATPTTDDLIVTVDDPLGTPASKKVTIENLFFNLADYIKHGGDADTYLGFDAADSFTMLVGNEEMIDVTEDDSQDIFEIGDGGDIDIDLNDDVFIQGSDGNVGIGTTAPAEALHIARSNGYGGAIFDVYDNGATFPYLRLRKSNSDSIGTTTTTEAGNTLGKIYFYGVDSGSVHDTGATITGIQDGAAGATVPTNIVLETYSSTALNSNQLMLHNDGKVGIGTASPNQKLTVEGSISLVDQAAAAADTAGYGQIWVSNATPDELYFTDDAGTDTQISPHPFDAPVELYQNGPGLDWMGKRVQKYLGVIFWQTLDGTITEETFTDYNARRKNVPGHVDLVKKDWDTVQMSLLRADAMNEVIEEEVASVDAFEDVEITEDVQTSEKTKYAHDKMGNVFAVKEQVKTKRGTGNFEKRLKSGISFNSENGKFMRKRQKTEAEVDALNLKVPEMPKWMRDWMERN